jgi:hypothetical protein
VPRTTVPIVSESIQVRAIVLVRKFIPGPIAVNNTQIRPEYVTEGIDRLRKLLSFKTIETLSANLSS